MSSDSLTKISIDDLKPGMYVESIAEQKGNLQVASRGKVTSRVIVGQLRRRGVLAVLIDPTKQFEPDPEEVEEEPVQEEEEQAPVPEKKKQKLKFDQEIAVANKLHKKGKSIQKQLLNSVAKGLPTDISVPEEFSRNLVGSIDRNPNALLCLTEAAENLSKINTTILADNPGAGKAVSHIYAFSTVTLVLVDKSTSVGAM